MANMEKSYAELYKEACNLEKNPETRKQNLFCFDFRDFREACSSLNDSIVNCLGESKKLRLLCVNLKLPSLMRFN